ncbi:hypothetical protein PPERSA_07876 [Pseudocohnilembus persalinus]|uniref:Transmembrane protein n=1 Tax=Pseudocohnilembus persalinus TaxID=266149 RepID=A0A0V0QCH2_PSEPJ|nr:hypothetical protein PPERSA_07876 [Pseudocohnilembus persalinus]|eukprot:KRW99799.1 hypothetical protein PPERSA_07876 [Pseudocohnilembus persalinus]
MSQSQMLKQQNSEEAANNMKQISEKEQEILSKKKKKKLSNKNKQSQINQTTNLLQKIQKKPLNIKKLNKFWKNTYKMKIQEMQQNHKYIYINQLLSFIFFILFLYNIENFQYFILYIYFLNILIQY